MNESIILESRRAEPSSTTTDLVLQRLPLGRDIALRDLYYRVWGERPGWQAGHRVEKAALVTSRLTVLSFDTYFGAFFERAWRGPTRLRSLTLDVTLTGSFLIRVKRRVLHEPDTMLHEEVIKDIDGTFSVDLPTPTMTSSAGRLFAELTSLRDGGRVEGLAWRTLDTPIPEPVGLVPVFCTFGREVQLGEVLATIGSDESVWSLLPAVVVVNQGLPGLAQHPAIARLPAPFRARIRIFEQGNFGGAGGFTRGLLETQRIPGATHALLMDDDVAVEPEALRRTHAFFSIAKPRQVLGGHMLDMMRPTRLYEAGARIDEQKWYLQPLRFDMPLGDPGALDWLARPEAMLYNGWWFFGLPLALLEETGLPLPCFIRGDDVEFGVRLHERGVPTVGLPGAAIWHEPFYIKLHNWQLYYETRNMLVAAAIHFPRSRTGLALLLLKRLLIYLLSYRYYSAALLLRGIEDYLRGPDVYRDNPQDLHASLARDKAAYPPETFSRDQVARETRLPRDPRQTFGFVARMIRILIRNWTAPSGRPGRPVRVDVRDLVWFRIGSLDDIVVETQWDPELPVFRRSRTAFRRQTVQGARLLWRILRRGDAAAQSWREACPSLTTKGFWRSYLGLE